MLSFSENVAYVLWFLSTMIPKVIYKYCKSFNFGFKSGDINVSQRFIRKGTSRRKLQRSSKARPKVGLQYFESVFYHNSKEIFSLEIEYQRKSLRWQKWRN